MNYTVTFRIVVEASSPEEAISLAIKVAYEDLTFEHLATIEPEDTYEDSLYRKDYDDYPNI